MFGKNEMLQILDGNASPLAERERGRERERDKREAHQGEIWADVKIWDKLCFEARYFFSRFGEAVWRGGATATEKGCEG